MEKFIYILTNNIYLYWSIIIILLIVDVILAIISLNKKKREEIKKSFVEAQRNGEGDNLLSEELQNIILKMKKDMEAKPEEVVSRFEEEQEKNAIISYQELVESVKKGKIQTIDDEQGTVDYVEQLNEEAKIEPIVSNNIVNEEEKIQEKIKFKNTDFISPVYGRMDQQATVNKVDIDNNIEKTINVEGIKNELEKNEAFLKALIDFRNNL